MQPDSRQTDRHQTDGESFFHLFKISLNILIATAAVVTVPVSRYEIPLFIFYWSPMEPGFEIVLFFYTHMHMCIRTGSSYRPIFKMCWLNSNRIACTIHDEISS